LTNSAFYQLQFSYSFSSITLHGENDSPSEKEAGYLVNSVMMNFCAKVTNLIAKVTNSIAKVTNSIAKTCNSYKVYRALTLATFNINVFYYMSAGADSQMETGNMPTTACSWLRL